MYIYIYIYIHIYIYSIQYIDIYVYICVYRCVVPLTLESPPFSQTANYDVVVGGLGLVNPSP